MSGLPSPEQVLASFSDAAADKPPEEALPATTRIDLDVKDASGRVYQGTFTYKVPTIADQINIGRMKTAYLPAGSPADRVAELLVEQISYLAVTLQGEKPAWYKPMDMHDAAPISALYARCISYEARFLGGGAQRAGDPEESGSAREHDGNRKTDVGRKVQPAAKRRETLVSNDEGSD